MYSLFRIKGQMPDLHKESPLLVIRVFGAGKSPVTGVHHLNI